MTNFCPDAQNLPDVTNPKDLIGQKNKQTFCGNIKFFAARGGNCFEEDLKIQKYVGNI